PDAGDQLSTLRSWAKEMPSAEDAVGEDYLAVAVPLRRPYAPIGARRGIYGQPEAPTTSQRHMLDEKTRDRSTQTKTTSYDCSAAPVELWACSNDSSRTAPPTPSTPAPSA